MLGGGDLDGVPMGSVQIGTTDSGVPIVLAVALKPDDDDDGGDEDGD